MKQLSSRTAVVTGAGSGIGRATSLALARRGCSLALGDLDEAALRETEQLLEPLRVRVTTHVVDVADRARMEEFANDVRSQHAAVHLLVNNAGVSVNANFIEHSLADFEWLMGINFWGVVYGCKLFLPLLLAADEGHIVNIASVFGMVGMPRQASYCASKFAVRGFSETLRAELRTTSRVGVTTVYPGGIATNIAARMRVSGDERARQANAQIVEDFKTKLSPDIAAKHIVRGIEQNRARVLITPETHLAEWSKRLLPDLSSELISWGYELYRRKNL